MVKSGSNEKIRGQAYLESWDYRDIIAALVLLCLADRVGRVVVNCAGGGRRAVADYSGILDAVAVRVIGNHAWHFIHSGLSAALRLPLRRMRRT